MKILDQTNAGSGTIVEDVRVAYWIRDCETCDEVQKSVYRLDPPMDTDDGPVSYAVSSTTWIPCRFGDPVETLVFRSDVEGNITNWVEIGGGRTIDSPDDGIRDIGYLPCK